MLVTKVPQGIDPNYFTYRPAVITQDNGRTVHGYEIVPAKIKSPNHLNKGGKGADKKRRNSARKNNAAKYHGHR